MTLRSEVWRPKGIADLEPAAWTALKHLASACVLAGPGAGKTEFLAQKAAFLLESGKCGHSFRILAISFKKDAAENLSHRVRNRCRSDLALRLESVTFDAFTKGLVDRFRLGLPAKWRPPECYDIENFKDHHYQSFLDTTRDLNPAHQYEIAAVRVLDFKNQILGMHKLSDIKPTAVEDRLARLWFKQTLAKGQIDFLSLNRLAEWLIRSVPPIKRAIQQTYPFVFVDEFQDTTFAQYDFLHSLFVNSKVSITTVGDDKQGIMRWAGARSDAFNSFASDFNAVRFVLLMNYRSSPGLVAIQHHLARSIEPNCGEAQAIAPQVIDEDYAQIWNFTNPAYEYNGIAQWIARDMQDRQLQPTDYAVLVRQKPDDFFQQMVPAFSRQSLTLRNEAARCGKLAIQDIVQDDVFLFIGSLFRLAIQTPSPIAWARASDFMNLVCGNLNGEGEDRGKEGSLGFFLNQKLRPKLANYDSPDQSIDGFIDAILDFVGIETIRGLFPHYAVGENWDIFLESVRIYLKCCASNEHSWLGFIRLVEGDDQVPLLTIHKSKGLEYDTIIFVGLDDQSWWNYSRRDAEGKATFFVALSRAKQRVIFTYSKGQYGRSKISDLYDLLKQARVTEKIITTSSPV